MAIAHSILTAYTLQVMLILHYNQQPSSAAQMPPACLLLLPLLPCLCLCWACASWPMNTQTQLITFDDLGMFVNRGDGDAIKRIKGNSQRVHMLGLIKQVLMADRGEAPVVVHIGANIGIEMLQLGAQLRGRHPGITLHAVQADPLTYTLLSKSIVLNSPPSSNSLNNPQVQAHRALISDSPQPLEACLRGDTLKPELLPGPTRRKCTRKYQVPTVTTILQFLQAASIDIGRVAVVYVTSYRMQAQVLQGCLALLSSNRRAVYVVEWGVGGSPRKDLQQLERVYEGFLGAGYLVEGWGTVGAEGRRLRGYQELAGLEGWLVLRPSNQ